MIAGPVSSTPMYTAVFNTPARFGLATAGRERPEDPMHRANGTGGACGESDYGLTFYRSASSLFSRQPGALIVARYPRIPMVLLFLKATLDDGYVRLMRSHAHLETKSPQTVTTGIFFDRGASLTPHRVSPPSATSLRLTQNQGKRCKWCLRVIEDAADGFPSHPLSTDSRSCSSKVLGNIQTQRIASLLAAPAKNRRELLAPPEAQMRRASTMVEPNATSLSIHNVFHARYA
ncbi:hypothetical protein BDK51DRAFT_49273 [Blyttiomyces helicus]|uniref:Uncharacterized protein n=1 Tax=Blyttiomyces helicus TaxID=388810 RepID=A0A4P9W0N9_9FUNG|nr:hypothetical protein BDK51DRAFT_49273 [Blyttiomyces helicus]|eukprot:RKO84248.1 hypothetical protein BDK51DRAFT_49273 [Blyttiomyces helicus]